MSLDNILDDIKGDVSSETPSLENAAVVSEQTNIGYNPIPKLSNDTLNKFNVLYNTLTARDTIYGLNKVDLKIAQEVFTMLPGIQKTEEAKLTSQPSVMNKNILEGMLKNVSNEIPDEVITTLTEVNNQIVDNAALIDETLEGLKVYRGIFEVAVKNFEVNKPLIIDNKVIVDIFQENLYRIAYIDDTQLDYAKYENKLSHLYRELAGDPTLEKFLTYNTAPNPDGTVAITRGDVSLFTICDKIIRLTNQLQCEIGQMSDFGHNLANVIGGGQTTVDTNISYMVNNVNPIIELLNLIKFINEILKSDDQFIEKTKQLIDFIS